MAKSDNTSTAYKSSGFCHNAYPYLRPSLKAADSVVKLPFQEQPVTRILNNDLIVTYLVDVGRTFHYVQNRNLKDAGITEPEVYGCALNNLHRLMQEHIEIRSLGHAHAVFLNSNLEASLILIDELWDQTVRHLAPNGIIAAIPARDILAFCDTTSLEGIAQLREVVARVQSGDHLITPILFRREGRSWMRYAD